MCSIYPLISHKYAMLHSVIPSITHRPLREREHPYLPKAGEERQRLPDLSKPFEIISLTSSTSYANRHIEELAVRIHFFPSLL